MSFSDEEWDVIEGLFLQPSPEADRDQKLDLVNMPTSQRGHLGKRCQWLLADKCYDTEALHRYCDRYRIHPVKPLRTMKRKSQPGQPVCSIIQSTVNAV